MKILLAIFALLFLIVATVGIFINQPKFGYAASGERAERIHHSPYYKNGQFQNETPTVLMAGDKSRARIMWDFLTGANKSDRLIPKEGEIEVLHTDLSQLPDSDCYVWFGHSSFLLQLSGKRLLIDPVFLSASPVSFVNRPFKGTDY